MDCGLPPENHCTRNAIFVVVRVEELAVVHDEQAQELVEVGELGQDDEEPVQDGEELVLELAGDLEAETNPKCSILTCVARDKPLWSPTVLRPL